VTASLRFGRIATVVGILVGIATALIASGYQNIMDYIQLLFSFFNAPLFATFIIGMFWKRMTGAAGFWGLVAGTIVYSTYGMAPAAAAQSWLLSSARNGRFSSWSVKPATRSAQQSSAATSQRGSRSEPARRPSPAVKPPMSTSWVRTRAELIRAISKNGGNGGNGG